MTTRALPLALVLSALALGACRDNMVSVQVSSICAPPDDAAQCTFSSTCDAVFLGISAVDFRHTPTLQLIVQINNRTTDNADPDTNRANSHDAYVTEMEVEYDAPVAVPSWTAPIGPWVIPADESSVISIYPIDVATPAMQRAKDAIDTAAMALGNPIRVIANVRLRGKYQDETTFETAVYPVTIDACNDCLFTGVLPNRATFDCDVAATGLQTFFACPNFGQSPASLGCE